MTFIPTTNKVLRPSIGWVVFILVVCSWPSCLDPIDFEIEDGLSESIVIFGRISKGEPSVAEVTVSRVFDFNSAARRLVSVRDVVVTADTGEEIVLSEEGVGTYRRIIESSDNFPVEHGQSYKLSLRSVDGNMYESSFDQLLPNPPIDSIVARKESRDAVDAFGDFFLQEFLSFQVYTELTSMGFDPALLWQAQRTWQVTDLRGQVCYLDENAVTGDLRMYNPTDFAADRLEGFEIFTSTIDPRLTEGSLFEITQVSLSHEARVYWANALEAANFSGGMFEPRAGLIQSNVRNLTNEKDVVHGYFFATEPQVYYIKLNQDDFPDLRTFCPPPMIQCPGDLCCDCTDFFNSRPQPPDNWEC